MNGNTFSLHSLSGIASAARKHWHGIALSVLTACIGIVHLGIISNDENIGDEDAAAYALQGFRIADGKGLTTDVVGLHFKKYDSVVHPEDYWPPLQSVIIAISSRIFGQTACASKLPNIIAFCALISCVYAFARSMFSAPVALCAALMCMFTSDLALYSVSARSELVFILFSLLSLFSAARSITGAKHRVRTACAAGVFSGLAYLQRPIGLLIVCAVLCFQALQVLNSLFRPKRPAFSMREHLSTAIPMVAAFGIMILPYSLRNMDLFGSPFPDLASYWSRISFASFRDNPGARSTENINASLSQYPEMKRVYLGRDPLKGMDARSRLALAVSKGFHETKILMVIVKRSLAFQIILLFLSFLSAFFITDFFALCFLLLFFLFAAMNLLVIPFYQHAEQRYLIVFVPFICMFSAFMIFTLRRALESVHGPVQKHVSFLYHAFIAAFLIFVFLVPSVSFYSSRLRQCRYTPDEVSLGTLCEQHTSLNDILMSGSPYQTAFYSRRPVVLLPDAPADEILDIARLYNVSYMVLPQGISPGLPENDIAAVHMTRQFVLYKFVSLNPRPAGDSPGNQE